MVWLLSPGNSPSGGQLQAPKLTLGSLLTDSQNADFTSELWKRSQELQSMQSP